VVNEVTPSEDLSRPQSAREIYHLLAQFATLRREAVDLPYLQVLLGEVLIDGSLFTPDHLYEILERLSCRKPKELRRIDPAHAPTLAFSAERWAVVLGQDADASWRILTTDPASGALTEITIPAFPDETRVFRASLQRDFTYLDSPSFKLISLEISSERSKLLEVAVATLLISVVSMVASIYSMQVYDRVIPVNGQSTLLVLTLGALAAAGLDLAAKWIRSIQLTEIADNVDQRMARSVFSRFLGVRLNKLPTSVGSMAQRLRSYETARSLILVGASSLLVDLPIAIFLLVILFFIGGPLVSIPLFFLLCSCLIALLKSRRMLELSKEALPAHTMKTGHLVESLEGAEVIKSGNGGWRMLSGWIDLSDNARATDRKLKEISEHFQMITAFFQQVGYTMIIAGGAIMALSGQISTGSLIACSILSGRIMSPFMSLPQVLVQWAQTKASLQDLDRFWALEQDIANDAVPLFLNTIKGEFNLKSTVVEHNGVKVLGIEALRISEGESVAIIGPIGSGKTTLLRLLTGMYRPLSGQVLLDGCNLYDINPARISDQIAYVPQNGRLLRGTIRENLLIGLPDPGDDVCIEAAKRTGLYDSVIASHPRGLSRELTEGGVGLSGGQKQLLHVTRALLKMPAVYLLDEPTASMDSNSEARVIECFTKIVSEPHPPTFVVVTHKPQLVAIVSRVIVVVGGSVVMDGPREVVLQRLMGQHGGANSVERA
jgi:ATP-binding cassette, subfamily C, bacterial LapB